MIYIMVDTFKIMFISAKKAILALHTELSSSLKTILEFILIIVIDLPQLV